MYNRSKQFWLSFIFKKVNEFIKEETEGRVEIIKVEFREHGKNTAIYVPGSH